MKDCHSFRIIPKKHFTTRCDYVDQNICASFSTYYLNHLLNLHKPSFYNRFITINWAKTIRIHPLKSTTNSHKLIRYLSHIDRCSPTSRKNKKQPTATCPSKKHSIAMNGVLHINHSCRHLEHCLAAGQMNT